MYEQGSQSQIRYSEKIDPAGIPEMLVDLAGIKAYFQITGSELDYPLMAAGSTVTTVIRNYTGRTISKAEYVENFEFVNDQKPDRYLIETPVLNLVSGATLQNSKTGRILLTGGPLLTVTYEGGYDPIPWDLVSVYMELVRQQMSLMGHEQIGTARPADAPPERAVWVGTLKVEYAVGQTSPSVRAQGMGAITSDALAPYAEVLDSYMSHRRVAAT